MTSTKTKDLLNRLIILEKILELKTNECAYYRTKVHLIQMNSQINPKRSSSEDISQSKSFHRTNSLPSVKVREVEKKHRKIALNQNYSEEKSSSLKINKNLIEQIVSSYINKHHQQSGTTQDKIIQCNYHSIKTSSNRTLIIRLPKQFIKTLISQQNKPTTPKLKVHLSSELLNKLFQSIHLNQNSSNNQFTIQSQFGRISAFINPDDDHQNNNKQEFNPIYAKAEVKTHHDRLPRIRHIARTISDRSEKRKRHVHKLNSRATQYQDRSVTQTIETYSSDQSSN